MRRIALCLALILVPGTAFAAGWVAEMQEDEGGPVMTAYVIGAADGAIAPELRMTCSSDGVALRYLMTGDAGSPGSEADFLFENESTQATLHMAYEGMDGAFAAYFPKTDPVITLLETGSDVFVSESTGNYPAQSFPLQGSSKAIDKLLRSCQ